MTSILQRRPETVEHRKIDPVEHALRGTGDKFMCQGELEETVKGTVWNAILTDQAFIKVEADGSIRQRKELVDIHSVVVDPADRRAFFMYSYKSAAALQADKMKGVFGFGMKFDSFLQERRFVCATADLCFQWTLVINRLVSDAWQRIFESKMIHDPEIYQGHAFVIKLNSKGVAQERTVVLSTEWIYNVDIQHSPTGIKELKWALPIAALKSLVLSTDHDQPCAAFEFESTVVEALMDPEHMGAKKGEANMNHSFLFNDVLGRARLVRELERLVYRRTGKRLPVTDDDLNSNADASMSAAPIDAASVDLRGYFKKGTRYSVFGWSVSRYVKFDATGVVEWSESDDSNVKKQRASVQSVAITSSDQKEFTMQTSGKELQLVADSVEECMRWVRSINAVLAALRK